MNQIHGTTPWSGYISPVPPLLVEPATVTCQRLRSRVSPQAFSLRCERFVLGAGAGWGFPIVRPRRTPLQTSPYGLVRKEEIYPRAIGLAGLRCARCAFFIRRIFSKVRRLTFGDDSTPPPAPRRSRW